MSSFPPKEKQRHEAECRAYRCLVPPYRGAKRTNNSETYYPQLGRAKSKVIPLIQLITFMKSHIRAREARYKILYKGRPYCRTYGRSLPSSLYSSISTP
jgi:hypothetical protein